MPDQPVLAMRGAADMGALLAVVDASGSAEAMRGLAHLVAKAEAGRTLANDAASLITDLFGGSDPREVAQAARGALAHYGVVSSLGAGAEMLRKMRSEGANSSCHCPQK